LWLLAGWLLFALPWALTGEPPHTVWWWLAAPLVLAAALDGLAAWREINGISLRRNGPDSLALDAPATLHSELRHEGSRALAVELFEMVPDNLRPARPSHKLQAMPGEIASLSMPVRASLRGDIELNGWQLLTPSPWRLWLRRDDYSAETTVRVLPNFNRLRQQGVLSGQKLLRQLGIHAQRQRGDGTDFHQLRDYREGDAIRQLDPAASARMRRPITREYQQERNQQVVILLDASRRMRARSKSGMTHFDHALDASLLLAHIALHQGDEVALERLIDGQKDRLVVAPGRGPRQYGQLLESLYRQQPHASQPDYLGSAANALKRHRRRSLLVLVTNLRDEDHEELLNAARLLRQRHVVVLANLAESDSLAPVSEVRSLDDALLEGATTLYREQRLRQAREMQQHGVLHVDTTPEQLAGVLIEQYQRVKAHGAL
jgi:uncharacterized protein (DUF58 family)